MECENKKEMYAEFFIVQKMYIYEKKHVYCSDLVDEKKMVILFWHAVQKSSKYCGPRFIFIMNVCGSSPKRHLFKCMENFLHRIFS